MREAAAAVVAALPEIRQRGAMVLLVVILSQILRGVLADTEARVILPAVVLAAQAAVETVVQVLQVRRVQNWPTTIQAQVVVAVVVVVRVLVLMVVSVVLEEITVLAVVVVAAEMMAMRKAVMVRTAQPALSSLPTRQLAAALLPGRPTRTLNSPTLTRARPSAFVLKFLTRVPETRSARCTVWRSQNPIL